MKTLELTTLSEKFSDLLTRIDNLTMNYWTQISIDYANQRSYLDDLFHVYPTIPEGVRELDNNLFFSFYKFLKLHIIKCTAFGFKY